MRLRDGHDRVRGAGDAPVTAAQAAGRRERRRRHAALGRAWIALRPGDTLDLVRGEMPGRDAVHDDDGRVQEPAFVSCTLPEVFTGVRVGEPILFDDGRIRGTIRGVAEDRLRSRSRRSPGVRRSCGPRRASTCRTPTSTCRR